MVEALQNSDIGIFGPLANRLLQTLDMENVSSGNRDLLCEVLRFAARAEQELANRQMAIAKMEAQALIDPVTGLENYRGLQLAFSRAAAAAGRYGEPSILIILAINGLDDIRDTYKEPGESFVLNRITDEMRVMTRRSDVLARISQHEFTLLLTHCPADFGISKTAQLVAAISALSIPYKGKTIEVQAIGGCATFSADISLERAYATAHQMLAKRWEPVISNKSYGRQIGFGRRTAPLGTVALGQQTH